MVIINQMTMVLFINYCMPQSQFLLKKMAFSQNYVNIYTCVRVLWMLVRMAGQGSHFKLVDNLFRLCERNAYY